MMNATLATTTHDRTTTGSRERPPARILLVTHGYPPHQTGGAEAQAQRKARWWAARGDTVRVLAADTRPALNLPFDTIEQADDSDGPIRIHRLRFRAPDGTRPFRETFDNPLLAAKIERELETFRPDLVYQVSGYLFGLAPLQLAAARGIPTVLFAMDFWHACPRLTLLRPDGACCPGPRHPADCAACRMADRPSVQRLPLVAKGAWQALARAGHVPAIGARFAVPSFTERQAAVRAALESVSLVVVNSQSLAGQLRRLGVSDDRLLIVRQGLDNGDLPTMRPARTADDSLRVLFLGQITWHKGVDLVAGAVRELAGRGHAIQLRIHGQPTGDSAYRARIAAFGASPSIYIGEPLGRDDLMQELHKSDVLVVPSRWYENSPNVILEAFAAGLPVVVANHGGMAEMVRDGVDGLRFKPGDAASLARALQRLCDEPGLLERLRIGVRPPATIDAEMQAEEPALASVLGSSV